MMQHGNSRYTKGCRCKICKSAKAKSDREYYERNAQACRDRVAKWRISNPDYQKEWEAKNRKRRNEYQKERAARNPLISEKKKAYRKKNKAAISAYNKQYRLENIEAIKKRQKIYAEKNRDHRLKQLGKYLKKRYKNDPVFRLGNTLRSRINRALARNNNPKHSSTTELIGCSVLELKTHLESKFKKGMSWDDRSAWHIDHIRPCSSFDLSQESEQRKCFHWSNLQPLWKHENLKKGSKITTR